MPCRHLILAVSVILLIGAAPDRLPAQGAQASPTIESELPAAFVRRSSRKGGGKFVTAADIQKLNATATPQLLARVSGGDLRDVGNGETALVNRRGIKNTFSAPVENELCRIGIFVNDAKAPDGFDLRSIALTELLAVEFYNGPATVPPDLNATGDASRCGLLVLWVKGR